MHAALQRHVPVIMQHLCRPASLCSVQAPFPSITSEIHTLLKTIEHVGWYPCQMKSVPHRQFQVQRICVVHELVHDIAHGGSERYLGSIKTGGIDLEGVSNEILTNVNGSGPVQRPLGQLLLDVWGAWWDT